MADGAHRRPGVRWGVAAAVGFLASLLIAWGSAHPEFSFNRYALDEGPDFARIVVKKSNWP